MLQFHCGFQVYFELVVLFYKIQLLIPKLFFLKRLQSPVSLCWTGNHIPQDPKISVSGFYGNSRNRRETQQRKRIEEKKELTEMLVKNFITAWWFNVIYLVHTYKMKLLWKYFWEKAFTIVANQWLLFFSVNLELNCLGLSLFYLIRHLSVNTEKHYCFINIPSGHI